MSWKRSLLVLLAALALMVLAGVWFLVASLDPEEIREKLENRLSASFGLQIRIKGPVELQLLPPGASFADIVVSDGKKEILKAKEIRAGIVLLPLFRREIRVSRLDLDQPTLTVRSEGVKGFGSKKSEQTKGALEVGIVSIHDGTVRFSDGTDGETGAEIDGLDLELGNVHRGKAGWLSFTGDLHADRVGTGKFEIKNLSGELVGEENHYRIEPLRGNLFGADAEGKLEIDLNETRPVWKGEAGSEKLSLAELSQALSGRKLFDGNVKVRIALSGQGPGKFLDTLDGTVRISGADLTQHGFDLDKFIRRYRASRDIDLLDIGVYAFAGPVGALVGKGVDMARMVWAANREEKQAIEELVFNWSLKDGVARARDVAFRTRENRIAVKGKVNLSKGRYEGLTLGLLNENGCAELTEKISGPLSEPTVEKASMLETLAGSLIGILRKGWEIVDFRDCEPFYEGSVTHSKDGKKSSILPWSG